MTLFHPGNRHKSGDHERIWAITEIVYTIVDFLAAFAFVIGSVFFFYKSLQTAGTWLFLIGSIFFAVKPSIRLARELKYAAMGDAKDVADKLEG
ncbi:YrhK-like protein [Tranquillimonas rosea]|uniref:YrhK-like protein n=1 Tax=Tranquillimonas rosea TaxID=641238 RepID=A0A1H9V455_9RHOB|nr:YrhK family protein [Tranquillimonas rosea]SES16600.1 YrhK-like protein [Tranquillimonas rosea]